MTVFKIITSVEQLVSLYRTDQEFRTFIGDIHKLKQFAIEGSLIHKVRDSGSSVPDWVYWFKFYLVPPPSVRFMSNAERLLRHGASSDEFMKLVTKPFLTSVLLVKDKNGYDYYSEDAKYMLENCTELQIIKYLQIADTNPNIKIVGWGIEDTLIGRAVKAGMYKLAKMLLDNGALIFNRSSVPIKVGNGNIFKLRNNFDFFRNYYDSKGDQEMVKRIDRWQPNTV